MYHPMAVGDLILHHSPEQSTANFDFEREESVAADSQAFAAENPNPMNPAWLRKA